MKTLGQANIITPEQLRTLRHSLPQSWLAIVGILKGKKKVDALRYQKNIRKEWNKR